MTSFTIPAVSPSTWARPRAEKGKEPTFTVSPAARAWASESPTKAISGSVYTQAGIAR